MNAIVQRYFQAVEKVSSSWWRMFGVLMAIILYSWAVMAYAILSAINWGAIDANMSTLQYLIVRGSAELIPLTLAVVFSIVVVAVKRRLFPKSFDKEGNV